MGGATKAGTEIRRQRSRRKSPRTGRQRTIVLGRRRRSGSEPTDISGDVDEEKVASPQQRRLGTEAGIKELLRLQPADEARG